MKVCQNTFPVPCRAVSKYDSPSLVGGCVKTFDTPSGRSMLRPYEPQNPTIRLKRDNREGCEALRYGGFGGKVKGDVAKSDAP